ncbi:GNAT family N-acetyltransferase [Mesorhizobium sp. KR1-2]|uniref:GNAT family N-acetyltransferase n=1 Tax=Mesorhizobium sp. KR1-2 TaxID=3156609 RepID=UPI0032B57CD9
MVDAAASFGNAVDGAAMPAGALEVRVSAATPAALAAYAQACADGLFAPAQSALWVESWVSEARPDGLIVKAAEDGRTVFALALEITRVGPFRVARFMGGTHAIGNFAPALPGWCGTRSSAGIAEIVAAIRAARPDLDALLLQRLALDLDGVKNPLLALPHVPSPNIALAVDLRAGFDAVLERTSAKRKRKKHRAQTRKFEAAGGFRRIVADTPEETRRLFDAFLAMKEQRFRVAGVTNVFAEAEIRAFFHALFAGSLRDGSQGFTLEGLEVGGKLRAITGTSRCGKRLICEFGGISDDELAAASPGEFLFYENIESACDDGFEIYDFSVGDEPYKRLWCNIEIRQADALVPLSVKGHGFAAAMRLTSSLKAFIKNSPLVWKIVKALRKRAAGQRESAED